MNGRDDHLRGMYVALSDAQQRQSEVRAELGADTADHPNWLQVRIEPCMAAPPATAPSREQAGEQQRQMLDLVDRLWGLLAIPEMGTGHFFSLDTYLVVRYRNRLVVPAFQSNQCPVE